MTKREVGHLYIFTYKNLQAGTGQKTTGTGNQRTKEKGTDQTTVNTRNRKIKE